MRYIAILTGIMLGVVSMPSTAADFPGGAGGNLPCNCFPPKVRSAPKVAVSYPLCFYDVELGAVEAAKAAWPGYAARLSKMLGTISGSEKSVSVVSSRLIVVWTSAYRQRQISNIWADAACFGQTGGETSANRRKICVKFIQETLKSRGAEAVSPEPVCQTFPIGPS